MKQETALRWLAGLGLAVTASLASAGQCPAKPAPGSVISDPPMIYASNGVVGGKLAAWFDGDPAGGNITGRYCLLHTDVLGRTREAPVIRLKPGERIGFTAENHMPSTPITAAHAWNPALGTPCTPEAVMRSFAFNLHMHGTSAMPGCGSDEVITTVVQPGGSWKYDMRFPVNSPPGMDWYHPHIHTLAQDQMLGGMTGAVIVDNPAQLPNVVRNLRERVLILRDQDRAPAPAGVTYLERPDVLADRALPRAQRSIFDALNQPATDAELDKLLAGGTLLVTQDGGKSVHPAVVPPWKDLSVNWVSPRFQPTAAGVAGYAAPGVIRMEGRREFWRVANASADSYVRLQVRYSGAPKTFWLASMDGVPLTGAGGGFLFDPLNPLGVLLGLGESANRLLPRNELLLPPGSRAEFVIDAPLIGQTAEVVSLAYETAADSNPQRTLAKVQAPSLLSLLTSGLTFGTTLGQSRTRFVDSASLLPAAKNHHTLYFSQDDEAGEFYITEDASTDPDPGPEKAFGMRDGPSIVVPPGAVQQWRIENRATEAHVFHIHQIHFRVLGRQPAADSLTQELDRMALRDTVDLPAWSGSGPYPAVTLRMYFNEADIRGNFVYHCHILEHEDNGMMAIVRVGSPVVVAGAKLRAAIALAEAGRRVDSAGTGYRSGKVAFTRGHWFAANSLRGEVVERLENSGGLWNALRDRNGRLLDPAQCRAVRKGEKSALLSGAAVVQ
ncbi:multicopper oxidase family protein [Derxia lacustris]|uniref:multicopper oxidase family protein n=1 Tax=Derxia lacustris TaxID=764842 RepID=UPI000A1787E2|nr:multicopper oxidase domain-containing protein [Derxia lacustris]